MSGSFLELEGIKIFKVPRQGPEFRNGRDAVDLMSAAAEQRAALILIPVERFGEDFFDLRTQIAGEIAQKFAMYGARVAILGDISNRTGQGKSFTAFVLEANRGERLWFVQDFEELKQRLSEQRFPAPSQ